MLDTVSTVSGSGWVRSFLQPERVYDVPTRYREVVLTVSKGD